MTNENITDIQQKKDSRCNKLIEIITKKEDNTYDTEN